MDALHFADTLYTFEDVFLRRYCSMSAHCKIYQELILWIRFMTECVWLSWFNTSISRSLLIQLQCATQHCLLQILTYSGFPFTWKIWKTAGKFLEIWHFNGCIMYKLIHVTKEWMVNISDEFLVFHTFRLWTMTESTRKILKLDCKTPGKLLYFFPKEWEPCTMCYFSIIITNVNI